MPLEIDYVTPSTGATASYHVVNQVGLDYVSAQVSVTVASYLSKDAKLAGKFPLYTQQVQIAELPDSGTDARAFAEAQLVMQPPSDGTASTLTNRYVFAGAVIEQQTPVNTV